MITIGKMSLACHCSPKTLRHYDQIGLLKPAQVDLETGFRYYSLEQIDTVLNIQRFKRLGFSLSEIAQLLELSLQEQLPFYHEQRNKLHFQLRQMQEAYHELEAFIQRQEGNCDNMENQNFYEIDCLEMPKQSIFGLRQWMGVQDFGEAYSKLFEKVAPSLPIGLLGARYYCEAFEADHSDIEVFALLKENDPKANGFIGGTTCLHTVHHGGYSNLPEAYGALTKWTEIQNYEIIGAPFEIYTQNSEIPIQDWRTDIYFPVQKKEG